MIVRSQAICFLVFLLIAPFANTEIIVIIIIMIIIVEDLPSN